MTTTGLRHHTMLIDGEDVDSDEFYEIRHPADEELVCTVARARSSTPTTPSRPPGARSSRGSGRGKPGERAAILIASPTRLATDLEEFAEPEIACNGATIRQATGFHVGLASTHFDALRRAGRATSSSVEVPRHRCVPDAVDQLIRREPIGVCAAIVPWNFPLLLGIWKVGAGARGRQLDRASRPTRRRRCRC